MEKTVLHKKIFRLSISSEKISTAVTAMASKINRDFADLEIVFLAVLNGSFMFASDLLKQIRLNCSISFVKVSSYEGLNSSGTVSELVGLAENLGNKHVIILEDIVDTGRTLAEIHKLVDSQGAKSIRVASLLHKPDAYKGAIPVDYVGFEVPNQFVVGYGLDYDGLGRNLPAIYTLSED